MNISTSTFATTLIAATFFLTVVNAWVPIQPNGFKRPFRHNDYRYDNGYRQWTMEASESRQQLERNRNGGNPSIGYTSSNFVFKVPKTMNTFASPVSASIMVQDSPDSILDNGLIVSRKSIQDWLREEAQKEQFAANSIPNGYVASPSKLHYTYAQPVVYYL